MKTATNALLLRRTERGDADLVVQFFTEQRGMVSAIAYGARRSRRRFPVLEPLHTLRLELDGATDRELVQLHAVTVEVPRAGYLNNYDRMRRATDGLRWLQRVASPEDPNPKLWAEAIAFLDAAHLCPLNDLPSELAAFGIKLLCAVGSAPSPSRLRPGMVPVEVFRLVDAALTGNG